MSIKKSLNKYEGIELNSLLFMADMPLNIPQNNMNEIWQEIFNRYFANRNFNVYNKIKSLNKEVKYLYFSIAMQYELKNEFTSIPVEHVTDFISLILEFIEFVDKKVLANKDLTVEWTLHEFYGMKDMLDKVKKANIADTQLRQKINLFIDKINKAREETLKTVTEEESNKSLMTVSKKELMQQTLQHLSIPVSKLNKGQLYDSLKNIEIYYLEDKIKLIKRCAKYYPDDLILDFPHLAFDYYVENPNPNIDMNKILLRMDYANNFNHSYKKDKESVLEWIKTVPNCTEILYKRYEFLFYSKLTGDSPSKKVLNEILEDLHPLIKSYSGKTLSEILKADSIKNEILNFIRCGEPNSIVPELKWNGQNFEFAKDNYPYKEYSLIEFPNELRKLVDNHLFLYSGWITQDNSIRYYIPMNKEVVETFVKFYERIIIDKEGLEICLKDKAKYKQILSIIIQTKSCQNAWTINELELMFKDYYLCITKELGINSYSGWFRHRGEHLAKYFNEILSFYDFSTEEDTENFFKMKWNIEAFIKKDYQWPFNENDIFTIYSILKTFKPYEVKLIEDYMDIDEELFEEVKTFEEFENIDAYSRLVLESNGINTMESNQISGVKIKAGYNDIIVPLDLAKKYFVLKYFEQKYN